MAPGPQHLIRNGIDRLLGPKASLCQVAADICAARRHPGATRRNVLRHPEHTVVLQVPRCVLPQQLQRRRVRAELRVQQQPPQPVPRAI